MTPIDTLTSEPSNFLKLSIEIVTEIFSILPLNDLVRCSQVCDSVVSVFELVSSPNHRFAKLGGS